MSDNQAEFESKKSALVKRLKRVEGQLRGIQSMIAAEDDCERVAQQLAAARKALDKTFFETMRCAMEHELLQSSPDEGDVRVRVDKITALIAKYG